MVARAGKASASSSGVSSPSSSSLDEDSLVSSDSVSESEFSTDSESHIAPSVRRVRNTRVSRRRWRKSHNPSASTSALLPPAEPASTSLWTTREKQFEKFRSSLLSMPVPDGVVRIEKAKGYSLHVMSVLNWVLPDSILHSSAIPASSGTKESEDDEEEPLVTLGVHVSLFHAVSKRFFGNTWVSPELAVDPFNIKQARHPKDGTLRYVVENALLNFRAYFISDIIDANCVGVLELVAYEKDPDSKATVRIVGCGWTLLPLFARQQPVQSGDANVMPSAFSLNTSGDSVSVFTGSPRTLWELNPDAWSVQEKYEGSKFYYQLVQYEPMMSIAMFLRKNELVGALDPIPGLRNGNLANIDMGKNPKMLLREEADTTYEDTLASFVKIASLVPKSVQVEDPFELTVIATRVAINLRDEIEANLIARLRISRKAIHEGATSVEGEVSARVLKIALHNGRCFRTRQFTIPLKADPNGGDTLLCVRNHSKLRGFVFHPNMAIVVVLQYTIHFRIIWPAKLKQQALEVKKPLPPEEDVVLVTMGARALIPSDGKKLYLYDKHHHATAISAEPLTTLGGVLLQDQEEHRRVLHVDLLSGAPCRPYSDNTLYTPPDQVTRSLQSREVSVKDSFAFCDLKITIDEDVPAVGRLIEEAAAPVSPVKPTESNQIAEENEDYAADQWARKLLGKANSNPVLAQTLNALATSPTAKEKAAASPRKTPSPTKKQQVEHPTTLVPDAPTSELSRASKTLLTRYGYMESHDKPPSSPTNNQKAHAKRKAPKKVELIAKSIEAEVKDPFKVNEIRFHFAAYRGCSPGTEVKGEMACNPAPIRVYFTFQFYNFPPTRTETLRLSKAFDNGAGGEIQTYLLMRETPANKPSLAIQFDVDTTSTMNPLETRRFAEYLKWNSLYVDVWDADSLFQLGTFGIPLHELLRQGNSVKKFQAEVEISPPLGGTLGPDHTGDEESSAVCTVPDTISEASSTSIGRVQLLMSNYGLKGENFIDQTSTGLQPPHTAAGGDQEPRKAKHRVRARPLVETNAELYRLLSQEGFYGDRSGKDHRERVESQPRQRQGLVDANTLTPKEITILCDLFGARKSAGGAAQPANNRSTRIKCDLEYKTGLLALLSLRPPEIVAPEADPAAELAEDQPVPASESVKALEQTSDVAVSDHTQRLKRVMTLATKNHFALADAFALFDANKDGALSRDEFIQAMRSLGTVFDDLSDDDLGLLAGLLDTNKDGKIDYREFNKFVQQPTRMSRAEWRDHIKRIVVRAMEKGIRVHHVFAEIDTSGDGKLSYDEFERGLNQLGITTTSDQQGVRDLLTELDKDHDGTISYTEFLGSLGISVEENKKEVVDETVKDITEDVRKILSRLTKKGISFEEVFIHFDADRNGTLSVEEFTKALNQLMQLDKSKERESADGLKAFERDAVEVYVKTINSDGDMKIDFREFLTACGVSRKEIQQEAAHFQRATREKAERKLINLIVRACASGMTIHEVFDQFDSNSDGSVSLAEFQTTMDKLFLGQGMTKDDAALVAARFDTNQDGRISRREFHDFGSELQKKQQSLSALFIPHLDKMSERDLSTKMEAKTWELFCREELSLSPRKLSTEVMLLMSYFGFVNEDGSVGVQELFALCKTVQASKTSTKVTGKDAAVARLRTLLDKAKERGVDLKKSFAHFDANGDGEITRGELRSGLVSLGCFKDMADGDFDALVEQLDEDGSGKIDFSEFRALVNEGGAPAGDVDDKAELVNKLKALMEKAIEKGVSIEACFAHFDKDGDGNIKKEEFVTAMTELGFAADPSVINGVIKFLDRNESGAISLSEFKQLFPTSSSSKTSASRTVDEAVDNKTPETQSTVFDEQKSPTDEGDLSSEVDKKADVKANSTDAVADETKESTAGSVPTKTDPGAPEEATRVEASTAAEGASNVVPTNAVPQESEPATRRSSERLVHSSSLRKSKKLETPFRRTKTDPKAVSGGVTNEKEKAEKLKPSQQVSFAAVKATKRAELAAAKATKSEDNTTSSLGKEASDGLSKPWKSKPAEASKTPGKGGDAGEPAPVHLEQAAKDEISGAVVNPIVQHAQKGVAGNLDCNYAFNTNPEIRAVELKLRQTALDAYQRGILPLRVVSKFLEDADDRRGRVPGSSGRERSRKKRSELLRVEFLQVLMELGFTLLSDQSEDDERGAVGGMPRPVTKMNDHLYARQLERLSRYRQHIKNDESKAHKQLVRAAAKAKQHQSRGRQQAQDSLRRFEDEKNQLLRVLSYYRDGHKKSLVYSLLRQQVTTSLTLFPSFGDLLFFELPFTNPYNHNDRFRIELLLPSSREIAVVLDLEIVRSSEEWAFYRENLPLAYGFITSGTEVENEMIDDHNEVVMDSHDQLHVPMRLRWLDTSDSLTKGAGKKNSTIPVSVVVKSCSHGHTVALFNMELEPQPFACQRVLRFSHPASSIWRWKLKYPRGKFIVCMDPSVAMELRGEDEASNSGLAGFKCRVGEYPALETFYVVLYDDKYYARVYEVWQVRIQSKLRVDVHAVLGQSVRHELVIKSDGGSGAKRHVMCFAPAQHCGLMQFRPGQVFTLVPQAFNRIEFAFCAVETGTGTQTVVLVNLVDVETHELVGAWSVHVTLALPVITKTYALRLPVGRAAQKKISYSNPWDQPQTIMLRSSAPRLVVPREPVLQLSGNGQAFLRLAFAARSHFAAASEDIYLFINDKRTDQNEECLLFQVTYE